MDAHAPTGSSNRRQKLDRLEVVDPVDLVACRIRTESERHDLTKDLPVYEKLDFGSSYNFGSGHEA